MLRRKGYNEHEKIDVLSNDENCLILLTFLDRSLHDEQVGIIFRNERINSLLCEPLCKLRNETFLIVVIAEKFLLRNSQWRVFFERNVRRNAF